MIKYQKVNFDEKVLLKEINKALKTNFKRINGNFRFLSIIHTLKMKSLVSISEVVNLLRTVLKDLTGLSIIDKKYNKINIIKDVKIIEQNSEWYDIVIEFIVFDTYNNAVTGILKYTIQYDSIKKEIKINLTNISKNVIIDYVNLTRLLSSIIIEEYLELIETINEYIGIFDTDYKYKSITKSYTSDELLSSCMFPIKDLVILREEEC